MAKKKTIQETLYLDNWPRRRRWLAIMLTWMVANAQYLIVFGQDNALHQNALITLLGAIVATLGSYVFGAVWDDREKRRFPMPPEEENSEGGE